MFGTKATQQVKSCSILVPRREIYSVEVDADSPEEARELAVNKMREAEKYGVQIGTLVHASWVDPAEIPWLAAEVPAGTPITLGDYTHRWDGQSVVCLKPQIGKITNFIRWMMRAVR